jgi:voltage-gated potassium channel
MGSVPSAERAVVATLGRRWLITRAVLAPMASTAALLAVYYLLPLDHVTIPGAVVILVIGLALLTSLIALQVRRIIRSHYPAIRAIEALAITLPLFLILFAGTYFVMSKVSTGMFTQPLTRTDSLYFTVTVFSTTGFGDITAKTEVARLVVTAQMIADIVVLGLGARIIVGAVRRGRERGPGTENGAAGAGR